MVSSSAPPIDLAHLARQTMGDNALEREVLGMFDEQLAMIADRFEVADLGERYRLAHTLKGSARGIGAFVLGDCAAVLERDPASSDAIRRLLARLGEVRAFIGDIER